MILIALLIAGVVLISLLLYSDNAKDDFKLKHYKPVQKIINKDKKLIKGLKDLKEKVKQEQLTNEKREINKRTNKTTAKRKKAV